jgi:membrane protein YdbS with pleckstrin-like domain
MKEPVIKINAVDEDGWNSSKQWEMKEGKWIRIVIQVILILPVVMFSAALFVIFRHHTHQYKLAVYNAVALLLYLWMIRYQMSRLHGRGRG